MQLAQVKSENRVFRDDLTSTCRVHSFHGTVCSLSDRKSLASGLLLGNAGGGLVGLGNTGALLDSVELNVAVRAQVGGDATVSAVGSAAALDGAVDGGMGDHALVGVESLGLAVGEQVLDQFTHGLGGFLGPATDDALELLELSVSADTPSEATESNNLSVFKNVLQVLQSTLNLHTFDASSNFVRVLEVRSEVGDLALSG